MIKYSLSCENGHIFESWFENSAAYDKLDAARLLSCAHCGSPEVQKALMAPSVGTSEPVDHNASEEAQAPSLTPSVQAPSTPTATGDAQLAQKIQALKAHVEANSTYVGRNFAKEARDMHDGLSDEKPIYGEATAEETKSLIEDGVSVLPLPFTPKSKTN